VKVPAAAVRLVSWRDWPTVGFLEFGTAVFESFWGGGRGSGTVG
jgi:hypothetical protein